VTVNVAVSWLASVVTRAFCVRPPDVMVTSPNCISAACSVIDVVGSATVTRIDSRPRNVSFWRSGANHNV
jgi:hypothetical protein